MADASRHSGPAAAPARSSERTSPRTRGALRERLTRGEDIVAEAGAGRPALDGQAGLDHAARAGRAARPPALHRAGPLVAPRRRHAVAREGARVLRPALRDRGMAAHRPHQGAGVGRRGLGPPPVPLPALADGGRRGRVQRAPDPRLLRHRLRGGAPRAGDRPRHVAGALDPLSIQTALDAKPGPYTENDISPYFWHDGKSPETPECSALFDRHFADYRLRIEGLVENPVALSLEALRALPRHEQTTQHFCIQGWSGGGPVGRRLHAEPSSSW